MSGEVIKDFLVGLGFKVDEQGLQNFTSGITKATVAVGIIGAAVTAAAGYVTSFVSGVANAFDDVQDIAERTNTAADAILRLGYVAELTDSSVSAARSSLESLGQAAGDASLGVGRAKVIFEKIGISVKDGNGRLKDTSALMAEIGDKIKGMEKGQQLTILRRLGIDPTMIKALTTDTAALAAEFDALYKAAGIDANKAAEQSSEFVDTMKRLKITVDTVKKAIGLKFMDRVGKGIETLRKFIVMNMPKIINTISPVIDIILKIADVFLKISARIGQGIGLVIDLFNRLSNATGGWSTKILLAAAAWKYLNLAFLKTPLGQLAALAAVIALLVEDFIVWRNGGDSLIDWGTKFGKTLQVAVGLIGGVTAAIIASKVAMAAWAVVTSAASAAMAAIRTAVLLFNLVLLANPLVLFIAAIVAGVAALGFGVFMVIKHWETLKEWFSSFFGWLGDKFSDASEWVKGLVPDFIGDMFGGNGGAGAARLTPSPQAAASISGNSQNVNQKTEIIVQGATNPETTAKAVANQQNRVTADMARNMRGVVR